MATRSPWDSELFLLLAIVGYLAFNLHRAITQSRDSAEVAFWVVSYLLRYKLFRSIRLYALLRPGSPERYRASDSAVFLAVCLLALHAWKVLSTWLVFAAIVAGFFLLLSV